MYVKEYESIYGRHNIGSNVHNLVHIIEDMQNCGVGNLMEISTYQFENALRMLGLKLKHTNRPLEQIVCRTIEKNKLESNSQVNERSKQFEPEISHRFNYRDRTVFKNIQLAPNITLSIRNSNDSWFMTKSKEIVKLEYIDGHEFKLYGKKIKEKQMFFSSPINSMKIDVYECMFEFESDLTSYCIQSVEAKMMCLSSTQNRIVLIPLLHTLENLNE